MSNISPVKTNSGCEASENCPGAVAYAAAQSVDQGATRTWKRICLVCALRWIEGSDWDAPVLPLPHPDNPEHVDNLASLSLLTAQGYVGSDATLSIALYEYGIVWAEFADKLIAVYKHPTIEGSFDRRSFALDTDVRKEFNWVNWEDFLGSLDTDEETFSALPLGEKLANLYNYYGAENIFGSSYWAGFKISGE